MLEREATVVPPAGLVTFDGRELRTAAAWEAGFDRWYGEREVWEGQHPGQLLPQRVLSSCPWDGEAFGLPHAGVWSRPVPDDGLGVRCREHGLRPDEHS